MDKKFQAIISDIDGTLVTKGEKLMPKTKQALETLHKQGVKIGLASGRPFDRRLQEFSDFWGLDFDFDVIIGMNGGDLWVKGEEPVHFYPLKKEHVKEILELLEPIDHNAIVYRNGYDEVESTRMDEFMRWSIERNRSHVTVVDKDEMASKDTGKLEVHYNPDQHEELMELLKNYPETEWKAVITYPGTIEFQDKRIDKGMALREYEKMTGIPTEEILAFGDMDNDMDLLKQAGWGVCLLNGSEITKEAADEITKSDVKHDGVGEWLYENIESLQDEKGLSE